MTSDEEIATLGLTGAYKRFRREDYDPPIGGARPGTPTPESMLHSTTESVVLTTTTHLGGGSLSTTVRPVLGATARTAGRRTTTRPAATTTTADTSVSRRITTTAQVHHGSAGGSRRPRPTNLPGLSKNQSMDAALVPTFDNITVINEGRDMDKGPIVRHPILGGSNSTRHSTRGAADAGGAVSGGTDIELGTFTGAAKKGQTKPGGTTKGGRQVKKNGRSGGRAERAMQPGQWRVSKRGHFG